MEHKPFKLIDHPHSFMQGWRVLFLKARHKDGFKTEREVARVSQNSIQFQEHLAELVQMAQPGERIYSPAAPRDFRRAQMIFKQNMLAVDYQDRPNQEMWWREIEKRWISALMQPECVQRGEGSMEKGHYKRWLIDCDDFMFYHECRVHLEDAGISYYHYATRNGHHIITAPFNKAKIHGKLVEHTDTNPMMLWGF